MGAKGTNAKIKELKGIKPEKITDEQLKKVQDSVNNINRAQLEIGSMEIKKHEMMHNIAGLRDELTLLQAEFKKQKDVLPWKDFNKNMAVSVEYNLQY